MSSSPASAMEIKIQSTSQQHLIDMLSRNGRKQIYYDLKCTHWHNISHFISQITISTILLSMYCVLHTKVEPERSCQICILSIFGLGCTNWMNCISATTSTTFKCLDFGQSINLNMLPKLKNRSVFSGYNKSRLFWFPEKYQKSNLWELGGLTAAAQSYSWRIFTRLLHSESFILVKQPIVNNISSKNGSVTIISKKIPSGNGASVWLIF